MSNRIETAVLLAAGRGRRLRPYTDTTPKPLLPINGRPTLDFTLEAIAHARFKRVILVTHYLEEQIFEFVGDGSNWGLDAAFAHQSEMLGTAHALQTAAEAKPGWFEHPFLMSATDYILPLDFYADLITFRHAQQSDIAVSLKGLSFEQLKGRSSVRFASDRPEQVLEIVEKPGEGEAPSRFAANLIYIVPPAVLDLLPDLPISPRNEYEFPAAVNQLITAGYECVGLEQPVPPEWAPGK